MNDQQQFERLRRHYRSEWDACQIIAHRNAALLRTGRHANALRSRIGLSALPNSKIGIGASLCHVALALPTRRRERDAGRPAFCIRNAEGRGSPC